MSQDSDSVASRLAEVRAKRQALKDQLAAQASAEADEALLAAEELAFANEQAVAAAIAQHGAIGVKIAVVPTRLGVIIVKRAAESAFKAFSELDASQLNFDAFDAYSRKSVVYPSVAQYDAIVRELPGVIPDLAIEINKLMGQRFREQAKK